MSELYILLGLAVAKSWKEELDLAPFLQIQQRLISSCERADVKSFVEDSFNVMRAAYPFANNPYLEETVENLQPSVSRFYYLALEQRQAEMSEYLTLFGQLLEAVVARDLARIRDVLTSYAERSCQSILSALAAS
jgi:DNA-binding GntR family transcriptional regulator